VNAWSGELLNRRDWYRVKTYVRKDFDTARDKRSCALISRTDSWNNLSWIYLSREPLQITLIIRMGIKLCT
jgi:CTP:phosphocholine cytidylyltransferase-like protein